MAISDDWKIVFYTDENGRSPVRAFITSQDVKTQTHLDWSFNRLRDLNVQARFPLVRQIEGKLWELREESRTNIYRFFYVFVAGRRIVVLHGFQKKSQKTPRSEIEIAMNRMKDFNAREGGE